VELPSGTELHNHDLVKRGHLILQGKSSCLPVEALLEASRRSTIQDVIDACAAPGNKTSQLASLLSSVPSPSSTNGTRKIFAFDKDEGRLSLLKARMKNAGAEDMVFPLLGDFLELNHQDEKFAKVNAILLDPSCSGSGIVDSPERLWEATTSEQDIDVKDNEKERIEKLSQFQLQMLQKAMSIPQAREFETPIEFNALWCKCCSSNNGANVNLIYFVFVSTQVQYIVYSTCSIHDLENEHVVHQALQTQRQPQQGNVLEPPFELTTCLKNWKVRGRAVCGLSQEEANCLVRSDPDTCNTNGFFVSSFTRQTRKRARDEIQNSHPSGTTQQTESFSAKKRRKKKAAKERARLRGIANSSEAKDLKAPVIGIPEVTSDPNEPQVSNS
jgi:putative methyltransferase